MVSKRWFSDAFEKCCARQYLLPRLVFGNILRNTGLSSDSGHINWLSAAFGQRSRKIRSSTSTRNRLSCECLKVLNLVEGDDACATRIVAVIASLERDIFQIILSEKLPTSAFSSLAAPQIHFMIKQNLANIHEYIFCIIFFLDLFADFSTCKT